MASGVLGKCPRTNTIPHVESGAVSCRSSCQSVMDDVWPEDPKSVDLAGLETSQVVKHCARSVIQIEFLGLDGMEPYISGGQQAIRSRRIEGPS